MFVHQILEKATGDLEQVGIPSARLDAEILLAFQLQCDRIEFFRNPEMYIDEVQIAEFTKLIKRRQRWEPVAYLTGRKEFWTFALQVDRRVLIPRPDTEMIVEEALRICKTWNSSQIRILDLGTGSGAIAIALAAELPHAEITATDITQTAVDVARNNAIRLGLEKRIVFRRGDLFQPVDGIFDMIVSNPPYIALEEYENLPAGVKNYEPAEALLAGKTGLEFHEKIIDQASGFLRKNGWLLLEIGAKQNKGVCGLLKASGLYEKFDLRKDYAGLPRVVEARRK